MIITAILNAKRSITISGLILLALILLILPACQSKTGQTGNTTKDSGKIAGGNAATAQTTPTVAPKTYKMPDEVMNAEMKTLDGKIIKLSDYKGKVVLVNQWATWCGPCRMEIPELIKISADMKYRGVEIVGMTIEDERNTEPRVRDFVKQEAMPYDVVWATEDVWDEFAGLTGRGSIPQSFVINRNGELTAIFAGYNPARTAQSVRQAIEDALKMDS